MSHQTTLADRARWFVGKPPESIQGIVGFLRARGITDPTDPKQLDRMNTSDAGDLGAMQDAYDAGIR
jgi:hypothetical protein